jgi:hypothetical protein
MNTDRGTLTVHGHSYSASHTALVLIPPEAHGSSFSLYLHADALESGGGFLMLDHLPVGNVAKLEDLAGACISFTDDESDSRDTVASDPCDLATSGWTFPGYEDDDAKNWHYDSFFASIQGLGGNLFRIKIQCRLSNWGNDERLDGEANIECIGVVGTPPCFDSSTSTWSEAES